MQLHIYKVLCIFFTIDCIVWAVAHLAVQLGSVVLKGQLDGMVAVQTCHSRTGSLVQLILCSQEREGRGLDLSGGLVVKSLSSSSSTPISTRTTSGRQWLEDFPENPRAVFRSTWLLVANAHVPPYPLQLQTHLHAFEQFPADNSSTNANSIC